MKAFTAIYQSLAARIGQFAPRERALVACMAAVGAVYLLLGALEWSTAAEESANAARLEQISAERRVEAAQDTSRLDRLAAQLGELRGWAFSAQTLAIARVEAQAALRDLAVTAGMPDARVTLDPSNAQGDIAAQAMVLEARFSWRSMIALSNLLAQTRPAFYPNGITYLPGREPRFRLTTTALVAGNAAQ